MTAAGCSQLPHHAPPPPSAAAAVFGAGLDLGRRYADWLAGSAIERGLLGPHERDRLWERHLLNCAAVAELIPNGAAVVDLGSGAGLPGLVLAVVRPDLRLTLVEPMRRRSQFLTECLADLTANGSGQLAAIEIRTNRAEELSGQVRGDVTIARALARLDRLVPMAVPLTRPGGLIIAMKGRLAGRELGAFQSSSSAGVVRGATVTRCGPPPHTASVVLMTVSGTKQRTHG